MSPVETFHERQERQNKRQEDVYFYDNVPKPLRVQIVQIMEEVIGDSSAYSDDYGTDVRQAYQIAVEIMRKGIGEFRLPPTKQWEREDFRAELRQYILTETSADRVMSAVELVCRLIERIANRKNYRRFDDAPSRSVAGLLEINARLKQHGVGFEYNGEIIRIDSELLHIEAVKPALTLLADQRYAGAQQEFFKAYEHYRAGANKEAVTEAAKAFESVMKVILDKRNWPHNPNDPSSKLVAALYEHGLIPDYWQNAFTGLRTMLESAIPTPRNKRSAHGQGVDLNTVPVQLVGYVLHMTASTIVFLVKSERELPD